jgi:hypothetical protein
LCDKRLRRCYEDYLRALCPTIPIQDNGRCDKSLTETSRQCDEKIMEQASMDDVELVVTDLADVRWINPCFHSISVNCMMRWRFILVGKRPIVTFIDLRLRNRGTISTEQSGLPKPVYGRTNSESCRSLIVRRRCRRRECI